MNELNETFVKRCTELMPRGAAGHALPTLGGAAGPAYLETLPPAYTYWESLGYRIPMLEGMIMSSISKPTLHWNADLFDALVARGEAQLTDAEFRCLCPYPEARSQFNQLRQHIQGSRVLVVGSETYWVELLCALYGAAEVTTVEYRPIHWEGERTGPMPLRTITWEQFLTELPQHEQAYDMVLTYSSIEHSGLGRYGDPMQPLGDLYAFLLISRCLAPHGLCGLAVPVGPDLTHFNAHRIYGPVRIRALEHVGGLRLVGLATPGSEYLSTDEPVEALQSGWTIDKLVQLPLTDRRQPMLCFGREGFTNETFAAGRQAAQMASASRASLDPGPSRAVVAPILVPEPA